MQSLDASSAQLIDAFRSSPILAGLADATLEALASVAARVRLEAGEELFGAAETGEALFVVLEGEVEVVEPAGDHPARIRVLAPGEVLDEMQTLAAAPLPAHVRAVAGCTLARMDGDGVDRLEGDHPDLAAALRRVHQRQLLCRLHTVVGTLDARLLDEMEAAAGWSYLRRGDLLYEQGDAADRVFFVVSGRLRTEEVDRFGASRVVGEMGRGESVGEMGFFLGEPRTARVRAMRDSVLAEFTNDEFDALVSARPQLLRHVARGLVQRLHRGGAAAGEAAARVATIAVLGASPGAPVAAFCERLAEALSLFGPTLRLTAAIVDEMSGEPGLSQAWEDGAESARLLAWLEAREAAHRFLVFEAEPRVSAWTRRSLRQADRVLLLARSDEDPGPGETERGLLSVDRGATDARRTLVLVHPEGADCLPSGTRRWLDARVVEDHHHLRWGHEGDLGRLARHLAGRAVGLVLGGGGARGFAHIGVMRALAEAGVPVDMVGGTSMGASLAAQCAMGWTPEKMVEMNRRMWIEMRPHKVFTVPVVSILSTAKAQVCGRMMYGEVDIEDLPIPFFCVSSNLTTAEMVVHRRGSLLRANTASASLPGVAPPVLENGHLLVDGAILNNLPCDVMRRLGAGTVIASEVSVEEDATFTCDLVPTPTQVLRGRFWRGTPVRFPSIMEVVMRAALLHSASREREALEIADLSLHPPIDAWGLMEFDALEPIVGAGYEYARGAVAEWLASGAVDFPAPKP
jgi:predicted acylesterase/phospholipase RssA/CRP-like cAMP-binding protein